MPLDYSQIKDHNKNLFFHWHNTLICLKKRNGTQYLHHDTHFRSKRNQQRLYICVENVQVKHKSICMQQIDRN
jgi:hypothetical protein